MAALARRFQGVEGSPRRPRHEIYKYIAENEPGAWATCGTAEQREKATKPPGIGSRVHKDVTRPWDCVFGTALGLKFDYANGKEVASDEKGYTMADLANVDSE